jgi:hypothetical protein
MTVRTAELDSSVARLLLLADQIERHEFPEPVAVIAAPISEPVVVAASALPPPPPPPAPVEVEVVADVLVVAEDTEEDAAPADDIDEAEVPAPQVAVTLPLAVAPIAIPPLSESDAPAVPRLTPTEEHLARLEQVRSEIGSLAARRLRPRGRRRLEDAQREERELLECLGYDSYLDLMLTNAGTRQSEVLPTSGPLSGRAKGERGGNGGGASADIGNASASPSVAFTPPSAVVAESASDEYEPADGQPVEDEVVAIEIVAIEIAEPGAEAPEPAADEPAPFATSAAPTIADWLASPMAPPIAAAAVDIGA